MKPFILLLMTISIVFMVMGYMELKLIKNNKPEIEYRFIPRKILNDQHYKTNLENSFYNMFETDNAFLQNSFKETEILV